MPRDTVLTTRRLRMRAWRSEDKKLYARHCNTPEVLEWLGGVMTPRAVTQDIEYFQRQQKTNGFTFWVLERKRDNAFLGFCGLVCVDERGSTVFGKVEIGWRIRNDMWRRGYAFEAATAVIQLAFERLGIDRIVARVAPGNNPSRKLMLKLGLRRLPRLDHIHPADGLPLLVYAISK